MGSDSFSYPCLFANAKGYREDDAFEADRWLARARDLASAEDVKLHVSNNSDAESLAWDWREPFGDWQALLKAPGRARGMTNESSAIVQRLWNYCNVLRDDGVSYGDYVEQLTYLLFLKMADEQTQPPFGHDRRRIPARLRLAEPAGAGRRRAGDPLPRTCWRTLGKADGAAGRHLPQVPEQDSGPGQAAAADRADQRRDVDGPGHRRQGRRSTRGCCRRTPRTSRAAPASTSRRAR